MLVKLASLCLAKQGGLFYYNYVQILLGKAYGCFATKGPLLCKARANLNLKDLPTVNLASNSAISKIVEHYSKKHSTTANLFPKATKSLNYYK